MIFKNRFFRRVLVGSGVLVVGALAAVGAVVMSATDSEQARARQLHTQLEALHLTNFTLEQQAAIRSMQERLQHPSWEEQSIPERVQNVIKIALRMRLAAPTTAMPAAAPFKGNTTALAFPHTGASGFMLKRETNCSLSMLMANYTFTSTPLAPLSTTAATSSTAHYEQTLHAAAGLTSTANSVSTCTDPTTGLDAQRAAYLGKTSGGLLIMAGIGYVSVNSAGNSVLYATVDPTGNTATTFHIDTSAPGIASLATGDLNHDGLPDLIGVDALNAQIIVWITKADGTLQAPVTYPVAGRAQGAVVADINGDNKADVIVATTGGGAGDQVSILAGNGDGTLSPAQSFTVPTAPQGSNYHIAGVIAADLRGSGHPDLVLSNGWVYQNNGSGVFTQVSTQAFAPMQAASVYGPHMVAADFNKDGKLDLAVDTGALIRIFIGKGDDTFSAGGSYASIDNVGYISAADLDTDGNVDLWSGLAGGGAFAGDQYSLNEANALMGNGNGTFQGAPSLPFVFTGNNIADLDGDAIPDAVGVNADESMTSYLGTAQGAFTTGSVIALSPAPIGGSQDTVAQIDGYAIADLTGDGKPDLVVSVRGTNTPTVSQLLLLRGDGHGGFAAPTAIPSPTFAPSGQTDTDLSFSDIRLIDVNGDNKADLVYYFYDQYGGPTYIAGTAVQLGNGDGTFHAPTIIPYLSQNTPANYTSKVIASGDFNADGKTDLVLLTQSSTYDNTISGYPAQIKLALGHGDGTFATAATVTGPTSMGGVNIGTNGYAPLAVADMNGDGKADLLAIGADSNGMSQLAIMLSNGDGTFQAPVLKTFNGQYLNGMGLTVADFNADGKADVFISNPASVLASGISFGNGDGTVQYSGDQYGTYVNQDVALSLSGAVFSYDMNGDHVPDVLVGSTQLLSVTAGSGGTGGGGTGGGTAADFALSTSPAATTAAAGGSATTSVTVASTGTFSQGVALSCSGLPSGATCSFAPTTVTPAAGASATSTLTISTASRSASNGPPAGLLFGSAGSMLAMFMMPALVGRARRVSRRKIMAAAGAAVLLMLVACGGGGQSSGTPAGGGSTGGGNTGTPAGTYTVTISGVAGSTTHTTTLTLTIS